MKSLDNVFNNGFNFIPYQSVGGIKFYEDGHEIKKKLGKIKQESDTYGGGKAIEFKNYEIYLDSKNKFDGIHFYESIQFSLNGKIFDINFDQFTIEDLNDISDDFIEEDLGEGVSYTSKKLGIDFYFYVGDEDEGNFLEAVLFMSKNYYKREIDHNK